MQEVEISGTVLFRSFKEIIKIDNGYCFGVLDGKNFMVARTTNINNMTFIRWCTGKMPYGGKNVTGPKADRLLKMILERIPNTPENEEIISQMKVMVEKNKETTSYCGVSKDDAKAIASFEKIAQQKKKEREFKEFMDDKARFAEKNKARKAEKEAKRAQKEAEKQRLKELRQQEAQKRIQAERALKFLKLQAETYSKMVLNNAENTQPAIFVDGDTALILGHLDQNFYRIKLGDKNPSFFIMQNNEKIRKMSISELQQILLSIYDRYGNDGRYDAVLERSASDYDKFRQLKFPENTNILQEKIAICKNILIQKGLLTAQNVLIQER